jgi:hypothetical protein
MPTNNTQLQCGNGQHFWAKGYWEIIHAAGPGLAHCTFGFKDVYGNRMIVVTAGEVVEEISATAHVCSWHFVREERT